MSEVEVITVCENVCRDFWFFLSNWMISAAQNPIWALVLGGIISLLIWRSQIKLSEQIQFNKEKRELFSAFVSRVEIAHLAAKTKTGTSVQNVPEIMELHGLGKQINLVAGEETSARVNDVVGNVGNIHARVDGGRESFREALIACEKCMRKELNK